MPKLKIRENLFLKVKWRNLQILQNKEAKKVFKKIIKKMNRQK